MIRKILFGIAIIGACLTVPTIAYADNGGPPTIPAEASIPAKIVTQTATSTDTGTTANRQRLAVTGDNSGKLALYGALLLIGGSALLVFRRSDTV